MNSEKLMRALNDVGDDLIELAGSKKFTNPWRRWGQLAASIALVLCLGAVTLTYFPIGCGSSQAPPESAESAQDNSEPETEAAIPEPEETPPEAAEPETPAEGMEEFADQQNQSFGELPGSLVEFRGIIYVLQEEPVENPADLGEQLELLTHDNPELDGRPVFASADPRVLYVQLEENLYLPMEEA